MSGLKKKLKKKKKDNVKKEENEKARHTSRYRFFKKA